MAMVERRWNDVILFDRSVKDFRNTNATHEIATSLKLEHARIQDLEHVKHTGPPDAEHYNKFTVMGPNNIVNVCKIAPSQVYVSIDELENLDISPPLEIEGNVEQARYKGYIFSIKDVPLTNVNIFCNKEHEMNEYFVDVEWKDIVTCKISENPELKRILDIFKRVTNKTWKTERPVSCLDDEVIKMACDTHVLDSLRYASNPEGIVEKAVCNIEPLWSIGTKSVNDRGSYMYLFPSIIAS